MVVELCQVSLLMAMQELSAKARQLQFTRAELQQLKEDHTALQTRSDVLAQQLSATSSSLSDAQTAQRESAAELVLLSDKLGRMEQDKVQLQRQVRQVCLWLMYGSVGALEDLAPVGGL